MRFFASFSVMEKISIENLGDYRKDIRKITYSKVQDDHSVILVTEVVDNDLFLDLVQDTSVHIIFLVNMRNKKLS